MSRLTWDLIKNAKGFYVRTYRAAGTALIISAALNVLLGAGIYYVYFNQTERDYYATSGITPPVELTALDSANNSSTPLLASESADNNDTKVIPQ